MRKREREREREKEREIVFDSIKCVGLAGDVFIMALSLPGVTDFKAVKDSSTSDSPPPAINLLVITASAGGFFVFCILALCVIFTYRRKVGVQILIMEHFGTTLSQNPT